MSTRASLTRDDWIHAAQQVLVKSGIDAVRVDLLAKEMGITRGSFYYHFKSRAELLEAMERPLHGQAAQEAAAIELGIRAWARRDEQARKAIDEVDRYRLSYIEGLLIQAGTPEAQAADRAYLAYAYQLSLSLVHEPALQAGRSERHARLLHILIADA
ncbi:MAG: helix-turn-helix domain-containing protein [Pseudomonas sp.]